MFVVYTRKFTNSYNKSVRTALFFIFARNSSHNTNMPAEIMFILSIILCEIPLSTFTIIPFATQLTITLSHTHATYTYAFYSFIYHLLHFHLEHLFPTYELLSHSWFLCNVVAFLCQQTTTTPAHLPISSNIKSCLLMCSILIWLPETEFLDDKQQA